MISGYLVGDKALIARLRAAPAAVKDEVDQTVDKLGLRLELNVKGQYLRGPRPARLGVKTGRLMTSISRNQPETRSRFVSEPEKATAYVGTNVFYGALWEHGFRRRVGAGARGGPHGLSAEALATYTARHPPGVRDEAARPFLGPAFKAFKDTAIAEIAAAVKRGMAKVKA